MSTLFFNLLKNIWYVLDDTGIYILFGFSIAGFLNILFPPEQMLKYLGKKGIRSILLTVSLGIPLPLCSCSVLPTSISLKKRGAGNGAILAFLISTPESGINSIALTLATMGPIMAILRPLSAFITSVVAGLIAEYMPESDEKIDEGVPINEEEDYTTGSFWHRTFGYAFGDLFEDVSWWMAFSIVLSAVIAVFVPQNLVERFLGNGIVPMLAMLILGMPLYMCAVASTPIVASLLLKGLSPGAALVLLLVGPATNIGTIIVLLKYLGKRMVMVYLGTLIVISLLMGTFANALYSTFTISPQVKLEQFSYWVPAPIRFIGIIILLYLFIWCFRRSSPPIEWIKINLWLKHLTNFHFTSKNLKIIVPSIFLLLYLSTGTLIVKPNERGIISSFGRVIQTDLQAGFHIHLPYPFNESATIEKEHIRRVELGFRSEETATAITEVNWSGPKVIFKTTPYAHIESEAMLLTGDQSLVEIHFTIQYYISDIKLYLHYIENDEILIRNLANSSMANVISGWESLNILPERNIIEKELYNYIKNALEEYNCGLSILSVHLIKMLDPSEVLKTTKDIASALEDKERIISEAYGDYNIILNNAYGDSSKMLSNAYANYEKSINTAKGDSARFVPEAIAYSSSPRKAMRTRLYLETMERLLTNTNNYFISNEVKGTKRTVILPKGVKAMDFIRRYGIGIISDK